MRRGIFAFLVYAHLSPWLLAQGASVSGIVRDANTQEPLPGASIIAGRSSGTTTALDGSYTFSLNPGKHSIKFQYVGYKTIIREITLDHGQLLVLNIDLETVARQIDQVVVSAGRVEQKVAESTVSMSVIMPSRFASAHITGAQELITKSPGIEVLDGQASIRSGSGFSYGAGSRVLTLIDGLPVLAADAGNIRWGFLPLENISQIEIIKGASSVLYGSSALNGVINFRTARATSEGRNTFYAETGFYDNPPNPNWKWWGNSIRSFGSITFSHLKKYGDNDFGISLFARNNPGYRRLNDDLLSRLSVSFRRQPSKNPSMEYGANILVGYNDKRDFLLWENATEGALRQDEATAINLKSTFMAIDPFWGFRKTGRYSHDVRSRFQLTDNSFPDSPAQQSLALSFLTDYQAWYKLNERWNLNAGVFQYLAAVNSRFHGNHTLLNLATYLQMDYSLGQKVKMVSGFRIEHNSMNGGTNDLVPLFRAGVNYMALSHTFLRASWGQGYRYPSIAERHAATTLGAVRIFPNIELQPESGWNAEVGLKQGVSFIEWDGMVDVAVFYMQNKDMIEYLFGSYPDRVTGFSQPGFRADNTEHSRVYGAEVEFILIRNASRFNHTLSGGYLYTYPVEFNSFTGLNTDIYLKYRRKHSAKLSLNTRYRNFESGIDIYLRSKILNIDDVFLNPDTREEIMPGFFDYWQENNTGYFLADANLAWHINTRYKLSLAVKNIANTEYMGRPGDIRPHRNFSLRLSALF